MLQYSNYQRCRTALRLRPAPQCHLLRCATAYGTRLLQQQGRLGPLPASMNCNIMTRILMLCSTRAPEGQGSYHLQSDVTVLDSRHRLAVKSVHHLQVRS